MSVAFRLGNIFDQPCDLLVIPLSAVGLVTPEIQQEIRKAGLPFPGTITAGSTRWYQTSNTQYRFVVYVASVTGQKSSAKIEIVYQIGREVGKLAFVHNAKKVVAPLLGAGSRDLPPEVSAEALTRGFRETAPDSALLLINVRKPQDFIELMNASSSNPIFTNEVRADSPKRKAAMQPRLPTTAMSAGQPDADVPESRRMGVFISYSHVDAEWLERLQKHLKPLQREGVMVWDDTRLRPGEPWREEIRGALAQTKVAILLISADFLASDFIVTDELPPLLKAAEEDGAIILPVIISPSRFERMGSLSRFQAVNDPRKPLVQLRRANREKVLDDVARAVEDALKR